MVSYLKIIRKHQTQMMKKILLLLLLLPILAFSQSNLVQWSNSNFTPIYLEHHISALNIKGNGVSLKNDAGSGAENVSFVAGGWPKPNYNNVDNSFLDPKKYLEFTISPEDGYKVTLSAFAFNARTKGTPSLIQVWYSTSPDFSTYSVLQKEKSLSQGYSSFNLQFPSNTVVNSKDTLYIRIYVYKTENDLHIEHNLSGTVAPIISGIVSLEKPVKAIANDDRAGTIKNTAINIDVLSNDTYKYSGKLSEISIVRAAQNGTVVINGLKDVTYTPKTGYSGYDEFSYTLTNKAGVSNTSKVEIQILDGNEKVLVRWNKSDFTPTNYITGISGTKLSDPLRKLSTTNNASSTNSLVFSVSGLPTPQEFNGRLDSSKFIQTSISVDPGYTAFIKSFNLSYRGQGGTGNMTVKYSKNADFSDQVFTIADNEVYKDQFINKEFPLSTGVILYPGETLFIRIYIYNTNNLFFIDFLQNGEVGPAVKGFVSSYAAESISCQQTVTWDGINWSDLPTINKKAIIGADYDTKIHGSFQACALTISNKAVLSVEAENTVTVQNEILTREGSSIIVRNEANLIQINDEVVNKGDLTVERKANLKRLDYIYWASPVQGQDLKQFSPGTVDTRFYTYNEANNLFESIAPKNTVFGNNATGFESAAKGYAIRASNYYPAATATKDAPMQVFNAVFKGIPNNGLIHFSLKYQTMVGKSVGNGHNLIGNPYPSNIDFDQLVADNKDLIKGTAYFWTNINSNPSMQGGSYPKEGSINNYAVLNGAGSIPATQGRTGGLMSKKPTNIIEVGQGFIVQAKKEGVLTFKNAYRTDAAHGVFFNKGTAGNKQPRLDRYWLELKTPLDVVTTALVAYVEQASDEYEDRYDAPLLSVGSDALFTTVDDYRLGIQGRGYPLQKTDVVHLGAGFYEAGEYTLSVSSSEGIFEDGQSVYLKDKQTGMITNLTTNSYTFTAAKGLVDDRFELLYQVENTLGTTVSSKDQPVVYRSENDFVVQSKTHKIAQIEVYETTGQLIMSLKPHQKEIRIDATNWTSGMYVLKITTASLGNQNGTVMTKKIVK